MNKTVFQTNIICRVGGRRSSAPCKGRGAKRALVLLLGMGAFLGAVMAEEPAVVDIHSFGAIGDGIADDTAAIQQGLDRVFPKYASDGVQNFYKRQTHPVLLIPHGRFRITKTLDLSFRNDLIVIGQGELVWDGEEDGTLIEAKCSSRWKVQGLRLDGNDKAGTFLHLAGNGTADGDPAKTNKRKGKGNVSVHTFQQCWFGRQNRKSSKAMLDTIPYPADSPHDWYYSMDDSTFIGCYFQSVGEHGFAVALGSSENSFAQCSFSTPNGFKLHSSVTLKLFRAIFSLQANDKGAIYALPDAHIGEVSMFSCYLEGTSAPLFSFDADTPGGSLKALSVYGGLFTQKPGRKYFIHVPATVKGSIELDNPRFQGRVGPVVAPASAVQVNRVALGPSFEDYLPDIQAGQVFGLIGSVEKGVFCELASRTSDVTVRVADSGDMNSLTFQSLDEALMVAATRTAKVRIELEKDAEVTRPQRVWGEVEIVPVDGRRTLKLKQPVEVFGLLEVGGLDIQTDGQGGLVNKKGRLVVRDGSIGGPMTLVRHLGGETLVSGLTLNADAKALVDVSDAKAAGQVVLEKVTLPAGGHALTAPRAAGVQVTAGDGETTVGQKDPQ